MDSATILEMREISKNFGGIHALQNVKFSLREGEVHALLGENGAGKSTLMNILSGAVSPDAGEVVYKGNHVILKNPHAAGNLGIVKVHQELQLVSEMTVSQNIFLGCEPVKFGRMVDFKTMDRKATDLLGQLNVDFKCTQQIKNLSVAHMQMVEIAKALHQNFSILILDEPTSSLTDKEIQRLFDTVRELVKQKKSVIYISHRLDEIFTIADRATVFRDGKYIDTVDVAGLTKANLVKMMVGRDIPEYHDRNSGTNEAVVMEIDHLTDYNKLRDVSFVLNQGEILGVAGLVGSGRTEMATAIFGSNPVKGGTIRIRGNEIKIKSPNQAIANGIMLIPENRKLQGIVTQRSVRDNMVLGSLKKYAKHGILRFNMIRQSVRDLSEKLGIVPRNEDLPVSNLSGGNQQKVVLAKALDVKPSILILDEPTRGIDVNAKHEIYQLIRTLASEGISIIMISSELPEILLLSNRIMVMCEGKVSGFFRNKDVTEEQIMVLAMGENT